MTNNFEKFDEIEQEHIVEIARKLLDAGIKVEELKTLDDLIEIIKLLEQRH